MTYSFLVKKQYDYFYSKETLDIKYRINALKKLKKVIKDNENVILKALFDDLNKCESEAYISEIGAVYSEIDEHIKNIRKWSKKKSVRTPLFLFPGKSYTEFDPYGVSLIISPWNYPFQLAMIPLIGAISAGNTAIIKPSELSPNTSRVINDIINSTFEESFISVVEGGVEETTELLKERFSFIFFTGSEHIGKIIMENASKTLTPLVLELSGKSPVIIDKSADINIAARRVAFGKVMNAGQTCVAPDYVLIHESLKDEFVSNYKKHLASFFRIKDIDGFIEKKDNIDVVNMSDTESKNISYNKILDSYVDLGKIINKRNFDRVCSLMDGEKNLFGGRYDEESLKIEPTLLDCGNIDDYLYNDEFVPSRVMTEEIFGPLLPIVTFKDINDCVKYVNCGEKPLALYLFTNDSAVEESVTRFISFGGGCINDTILHLANPNLPFGGVGNSGLGAYHGRHSFDTFSHRKSIFKNSNKMDMDMRYMPYSKKKLGLIKKLMK